MKLLKNLSLIGADGSRQEKELLIDEGIIRDIDDRIEISNVEIIDCKGKLLMPGFIDAHVHLREPGFESKETIKTGTMAAAAGGFTSIMPMPNLRPVPDCEEAMKAYNKLIDENSVVNIFPYASITGGEKGVEVVDMEKLLEMGAVAFSDDGVGVQSSEVMKAAMKRAEALGAMIAAHTEDNRLKNNGYVHQGKYAEKMGWRGIPSACEYVQVERDIELVRKTGCKYHICHVSSKETIEAVKKAKREGLEVSCEITPHHLTLIDEDVKNENYKMNPPLRGREDREALIQAIIDGTADIIATDHAPHTAEEKSRGLEKSPFGIVGLETAFPVLFTNLVKTGKMTLKRLMEVMSEKPSELFELKNRGKIEKGYYADLVLIDTDKEYEINSEDFFSMGKNTPYDGERVYGKILMTMVNGEVVYDGR